jgi:uncharacterized protein (DUF58 family)
MTTPSTARIREADSRNFLDPRMVGKLQRLDLIARLVVEGFLTGLHKSPYHGFSVEFAEHRQYMPGDPVRGVDWKVFAKSDRYYIKQFEEETNLRAHILIDTSTSMLFRGDPALLRRKRGKGDARGGAPVTDAAEVSKLRYAIDLAAALAYLMIQQQDAVGLLLFSDRIHRLVPPRSARTHLRILLRELEVEARRAAARHAQEDEPRRTRIGECLGYLAERVPRRGLIILMTDFWDANQEEAMTALKHFRHHQSEVVVFHLQDPAEVEFPYREEGLFRDVETGEQLNVLPWEVAKEFRRRLDERVSFYKRGCSENRIDYEQVLTSTPFDTALLRYLEKRQRMR